MPHGQRVGLQMGEKAEADAYMPGFLRKSVSAPGQGPGFGFGSGFGFGFGSGSGLELGQMVERAHDLLTI